MGARFVLTRWTNLSEYSQVTIMVRYGFSGQSHTVGHDYKVY